MFDDSASPKRRPGRPAGRKPVAARLAVRLDQARYTALAAQAADRNLSMHSILIEAIDQQALAYGRRRQSE